MGLHFIIVQENSVAPNFGFLDYWNLKFGICLLGNFVFLDFGFPATALSRRHHCWLTVVMEGFIIYALLVYSRRCSVFAFLGPGFR
jgi:hypothetical protein